MLLFHQRFSSRETHFNRSNNAKRDDEAAARFVKAIIQFPLYSIKIDVGVNLMYPYANTRREEQFKLLALLDEEKKFNVQYNICLAARAGL